MENHSLGASQLRGAGGPLGVTVADPGDEVTAAILASAVAYGWDHVADANGSDAERIAFTPSTISGGRRTTSYDAYVRPALAGRRRRNLAVVTRTRVGRLLFDGRRCRGVRVIDRGRSAQGHHRPPGGDRLRGHGRDPAAARAVRHRPPRPAPRGGRRAPHRVAQRRRARHRAARHRAAGHAQAGPGRRQQAEHPSAARPSRPSGTCDPAADCSPPPATTWSASSSRTRTSPAPTSRACSPRWRWTPRAST